MAAVLRVPTPMTTVTPPEVKTDAEDFSILSCPVLESPEMPRGWSSSLLKPGRKDRRWDAAIPGRVSHCEVGLDDPLCWGPSCAWGTLSSISASTHGTPAAPPSSRDATNIPRHCPVSPGGKATPGRGPQRYSGWLRCSYRSPPNVSNKLEIEMLFLFATTVGVIGGHFCKRPGYFL